MKPKPKSIMTVRRRKKSKHPQVIVGADRTTFKAMTLTHNEKKQKKSRGQYHKNFYLKSNPNPNDMKPAFLKKQVIEDFKFNFSKAFQNYKISDEDALRILEYLEHKKRK